MRRAESSTKSMPAGHGKVGVERWVGGGATRTEDLVAEEVPVALVYGGISHAVMLATPEDLEDFALGFSCSEGILARSSELYDLEQISQASGIELRMEIRAERQLALAERRRTLAGRTGCGLCGIDSLDQLAARMCIPDRAAGPLPRVSIGPGALRRAETELRSQQRLFDLTGAVHAAAWCAPDGSVLLMREDVGRHNALDKLIGARLSARRGVPPGECFADGFVLMTSRASYEIVQKAATVGISVVAAVSAPTGMAVRLAEAAGVTLIGFARGGQHSVYSHSGRIN
jgi:phenylacetyl-CoA:acceptor oxidoreductase accessory protein